VTPSRPPLPSFPPVPPLIAQGLPGAAELARRLRDGEVSAVEIVETHIRRIEEVDTDLGAVIVRRFDQARREAQAADATRRTGAPLGPLHGLPITIKESFDVAGTPTTLGLDRRRDHRAAADAATVAALRRAGAIVLGKTNVSQLLMGNETVNPLHGRTANPWDTARSPGGSSGGEAAIIAAGGSAGGLGSDIGGSVRLPAHATGIAALKPTSTRLSMRGHAPLYPGQEAILAQPGPMAREVADLALLFHVLVASEETGLDPTVPPVAHRDPTMVRIEGLRVAVYDDNGLLRPAPALRRAVSEAAEALRAAGAIVEPWTPPDAATAYYLYYDLLMGDGLATACEALGRSTPSPRCGAC
jgi:fatty acid amide hydrolase